MKFVSVRDLRGKSAQIWKDLQAGADMVVTSNGKPVAILSPVGGETLEESLAAIRRARAEAAVTAIQRESVEKGADSVSTGEIESEIRAVRKKRAR